MASVPVASEIEVLDLRHFSARQLRPLLAREAEVWRARLRWDYRSSTELLLQYLDSHILQGFAALDRGRVCGYIFCVYEGRKAVIGDAFASGHHSHSDTEVTRSLLTHMLEMLRYSPDIDRVESQLLLYNAGQFADLLVGPEFTIYPRLFLECNLAKCNLRDPIAVPSDLELALWAAEDYQAAGELIYTSYVGHSDSAINDQYRSLHGSLRFLHNIVRFPGCGVFQATLSFMLHERQSGALVGMILCSRVSSDVAHVTQICIAPEHRGRGLGRLLLDTCAQSLLAQGFNALTLTVTEDNRPALRLYEWLGFTQRHRFDAVVLESQFAQR
jgi:ribosomal protein S18 acetylase RimI-like enzyme